VCAGYRLRLIAPVLIPQNLGYRGRATIPKILLGDHLVPRAAYPLSTGALGHLTKREGVLVAKTCSACAHDAGWQIDLDLVRRVPYRKISERFGISQAALSRHAQEHLPAKLLAAQDAEEVADADLLKRELEAEKIDIARLKTKAEDAEDYRTALAACDKALKALELQAKLAQLINDAPTINLYLTPEWLEIRFLILVALEPHENAREDVVRALGDGGPW
jgi:hypothetical protein